MQFRKPLKQDNDSNNNDILFNVLDAAKNLNNISRSYF